MNKIYKKLCLSLLCTLLAASGMLGANEPRDGEDILLQLNGREPSSKEESQVLKALRFEHERVAFEEGVPQESDNEGDVRILPEIVIGGAVADATEPEVTAQATARAKSAKTIKYTTTHNGVFHTTIWLSPYRDYITLNDGLSWYVRPSDRWKTENFNVYIEYDDYGNAYYFFTDNILILPGDFLSAYDYVLLNQTTGDRMEVDLIEPQLGQIVTTYFVVDVIGNYVKLNDNSRWKVSSSDSSLLYRWAIGDSITMGLNESFFPSIDKNILINVNLKEYVRGNCIN